MLAKRRREDRSMSEAFRELEQLAGPKSQWGILAIDEASPNVIYSATYKAPILVGFSPDEDQIFLVSEKIAFDKHVNCYFATKDGEVLTLDANKIP